MCSINNKHLSKSWDRKGIGILFNDLIFRKKPVKIPSNVEELMREYRQTTTVKEKERSEAMQKLHNKAEKKDGREKRKMM